MAYTYTQKPRDGGKVVTAVDASETRANYITEATAKQSAIISGTTSIAATASRYEIPVNPAQDSSALKNWIIKTRLATYCLSMYAGYGLFQWQERIKGLVSRYTFSNYRYKKDVTFASVVNCTTGTAHGQTIVKNNATAAWDSGAISSESGALGVPFMVEFTPDDSVSSSRMMGIGQGNTDESAADIDWAFHLNSDGYPYIYENGTLIGNVTQTSYSSTTRFRISIDADNIVTYYVDELLKYTSLVLRTSTGTMDCSIYTDASGFWNVKVTGTSSDALDVVVDETGYNDIFIVGTQTVDTGGHAGNGLKFNAATDYAIFKYIVSLSYSSQTISYSFWYKYTPSASYNMLLYGDVYDCAVRVSDNVIGCYDTSFRASSLALTSGNTYHIVVTRFGSAIKIYVDNSLVLNTSVTQPTSNLRRIGDGSSGALGTFDDFCVFNETLDATDVANLYADGISTVTLRYAAIIKARHLEELRQVIDDSKESMRCYATCSASCGKVCTYACTSSCSETCSAGCLTSWCNTSGCTSSCVSGCSVGCGASCSGGCDGGYTFANSSCPNNCSSGCYGSCSGTYCDSVCSEKCVTTCGIYCGNSCSSSCYSTCVSTCQFNCWTACTSSCTTSCSTTARLGISPSCTASACVGSCVSSCSDICQSSAAI